MAEADASHWASAPMFELNCNSQGLATSNLTLSELDAWLGVEIDGWQAGAFRGDVGVSTSGSAAIDLGPVYTQALGRIRLQVKAGNFDLLKDYLQQAERLEVLILQSELGASVRRMDQEGSLFVATTLSVGVLNFRPGATKNFFIQMRSLLAVNPFITMGLQLTESRSLRGDVRRQLTQSSGVLKRLEAREKTLETELSEQLAKNDATALSDRDRYDKWFAEREKLLEQTRDTYHKHVQTAEAARFWRHKTWISTGIAWAAFIAFGAMVSFAFWLGFTNLDAIKTYVASLASDNSTVSLTPVVVITVPVLAYAWVLRHLSRVFIQNLTIADDAAYRRLMTMTFLGLTNDPKSGITQAERAIILNALFRPAPPNTSEDGPPTGLLDIINKKV